MDKLTIAAYDRDAEEISELHQKLVPERLYSLVSEYFLPGLKTLDIGCGSGRDTNWLAEKGFDVLGVDASFGMLDQAFRRYPHLEFKVTALPELDGLASGVYSNVLCSAVLMHLENDVLRNAVENMIRVTCDNGILLVSIRGTHEPSKREDGKLYEEISRDYVLSLFDHFGADLLFYEEDFESARKHVWRTFVFKKSDCLEQ